MNFRECLVVRATFEHLLCLHSLQRSIYFPFSHMSDTLMDFSGCGRDVMCHVLFNLRADVYMFTSSLILENISGLECVRGVFGSNARPNSRIALFGQNARFILTACISKTFYQYNNRQNNL